jgi:hypothetical protein
MDLARAPRRAARKKGSGYENGGGHMSTLYPGLAAAILKNRAGRPWIRGWSYVGKTPPPPPVHNIVEFLKEALNWLKRFNPRYLAELPFVSLALAVVSMREGHNRI